METVNVRGLNISSLTLGTVQMGMPYGIANSSGQPDAQSSSAILDCAVQGGINCFDTARGYGDSERVLGRYFLNKPKPVLVSKTGLDLSNKSEKDAERQLRDDVQQSIDDLQLVRLPILMLHTSEILIDTEYGETVARLLGNLKREGLVDKIGISLRVFSEQQFRGLWRNIRDDLYEAVQIPINAFDQRLIRYGALQLFKETDKIVFARSVFLQGLFFLAANQLPIHLQAAAEPLNALRALAGAEGVSVAQLALAFIRDIPEIHSLVMGVETEVQLQEILSQVEGPPLREKTRSEVVEIAKQVPEWVSDPVSWKLQ